MTTGNAGRGQTVAATFEGPLRSDAALTALKEAGFRPAQVAVQVTPGTAEGGTDDGAGARTIALVAGAVLGAIVGAVLGRAFVGTTLALVLGALVGAIAGAAIAWAIARAGGGSAGTSASSGAGSLRPGSVTLTVTADSADQAQQARGILSKGGGNVRP
jgi:hypothetical protein